MNDIATGGEPASTSPAQQQSELLQQIARELADRIDGPWVSGIYRHVSFGRQTTQPFRVTRPSGTVDTVPPSWNTYKTAESRSV